MARCKHCNNTIPNNSTFCSFCGAPVAKEQPYTSQNQNGNNYDFFDMPDITDEFDYADIKENKIIAILAYISFLFLIPAFVARHSKFVRFHTSQGFNLFLLFVVIYILQGIINLVFAFFIVVKVLFAIVFWALNVFCFVLMVIGIYNVIKGKAKKLPIIGNINIIGKWLEKDL